MSYLNPRLARQIQGTAVTITDSGSWELVGNVTTLTVTADNVSLIGNGYTVGKMLVQSEGCSFVNVTFGNPAATDPTTDQPTANKINQLASYVVWSEKPAKFVSCVFIGDDKNGTQVGLLIGKNGNVYASEQHVDVTQEARTVIGCKFVNLGVGLCILPKMEYYSVVGCAFHYCSEGIAILAGNSLVSSCSVIWCRVGIWLSYPKDTPTLALNWTGELTSPTTYENATAANAFKSRIVGCLVNHCFYAVQVRESTDAADPRFFAARISDCNFAADAYIALVNGAERVEFANCQLHDAEFWTVGTGRVYYYGPVMDYQVRSGSIVYHNAQFERSADPADPPEGHHTIWQSDGTGAGDDGDLLVKITAGGVTKTATLVDYSAT